MNSLVIFVAVLVAVTTNSAQLVSSTGDPILIVPGITGSQLDVKHSGFTLCNTIGRFIGLWVSEIRFIMFGCFSPEMTLNYDRTTGKYSSSDGDIKVKAPGFGNTNTVEKVGQDGINEFPYFGDMVQYFVDRGYERGKSIRGAPYDWRLGPEELKRNSNGYYGDVKALIETMYSENGNRKVTIVAHSMGAAIFLHFFTQSGVVSQTWKDQYIGNFITLSGAWAGGNEELEVVISGIGPINDRKDDIFGILSFIQGVIKKSLRPILQTFQSSAFLLPKPSVWGNTILVSTPTQSYTANDYQQLFNDIGYTDGYSMYQGIENDNKNFPPPNVPTHCFYGVGVDTPRTIHYNKPFPGGADEDPTVNMGDGDGSVCIESSEVCLRWNNNNGGHSFSSKAFSNTDHTQILQVEAVLKDIGQIVGAPTDPTTASASKKEEEESWWDKVKKLFG